MKFNVKRYTSSSLIPNYWYLNSMFVGSIVKNRWASRMNCKHYLRSVVFTSISVRNGSILRNVV